MRQGLGLFLMRRNWRDPLIARRHRARSPIRVRSQFPVDSTLDVERSAHQSVWIAIGILTHPVGLPTSIDALRKVHSITSSAVASNVVGIVRPSDLAVFRLMTNLNLVGACTGRSAGFSPLRMRST
jgi:hypothetical protein